MAVSPQDVDELIRNRRSVFPQQYTPERVDDAIIKQIITNATMAPTHKLTQPWRFIVFTGEGLKKLAEAQANVYRQVTTGNGTFREDKFQSLANKPMLSSHIIVVCMKRDEKQAVPEVEEIGAVYCAIENMYLTATAYGVGCYLSTGGITYFPEAKAIFQLGEADRVIGFFHVGTPRQTPPTVRRKPPEELTEWIVQ